MSNKTVLLVDKSYTFLDVMKKMLRRENYTVHCAAGIQEAREFIATNKADAIIMEADLPDGSGIDFCRYLRMASTVPVMLQSSSSVDEEAAIAAGAYCYLKKPFDLKAYKDFLHTMTHDDLNLSLLPAVPKTPVQKEPPVPQAYKPPRKQAARNEGPAGIMLEKRQALITLTACVAVIFLILGLFYFFSPNIAGNAESNIVIVEQQQVPLAGTQNECCVPGCTYCKEITEIIIG